MPWNKIHQGAKKAATAIQLQFFPSTFASMSIEIRHLSKYYGNQPALDRISFSVKKGELVGFLGPNGAGKSTTMKIITGFIQGTEGEVEVLGQNVSDHAHRIRRQIGYLPEHNPLYTDLYVHEYLRFAGRLHGLRGVDLTTRVGEMIHRCGLTKEQNKKIESLSRGYRQRVGIAQALLHDPSVLILDEPTSGLDPNQLAEIRQLIREVSAEKTVLFSTHIMQEVEAICDRVVIIHSGKIVADDQLSNLVSSKTANTLAAEFSQPVDISVFRNLSGLDGIRADEGTERNALKITIFYSGADPRPAIFQLVSEQKLPLVSLNISTRSLEDIFRSLTSNHPSEKAS